LRLAITRLCLASRTQQASPAEHLQVLLSPRPVTSRVRAPWTEHEREDVDPLVR
jgi:hypothetical protein